MPRLLHDRYLRVDDARACDLVTGHEVSLDSLSDVAPQHLDAEIAPILETIIHGREGWPRWVRVPLSSSQSPGRWIDRVAAASSRQGFVTIAASLYFQIREVLESELAGRTLLLAAASGGDDLQAHLALMDVAARAPRPHALITFVASAAKPDRVHEARAAYRPAGRELPQRDHEVTLLLERARKARLCAANGRHAAADRGLLEVIAALTRRGAAAAAARVSIVRARLLLERGRGEEADVVLHDAARSALSAHDRDLAAEARLWQASGRVARELFIEAEAICRAVLASDDLPRSIRVWAGAFLTEALLWQGAMGGDARVSERSDDPEFDDPVVGAMVRAIEVRALLWRGQVFEAGHRLAGVRASMSSSGAPLVAHIAHAADLAVLAAAGDLSRAREALFLARATARAARAPLRAAWSTLDWVDALVRAGCATEARKTLESLRHVERVAPPLLKREIGRRQEHRTSQTRVFSTGPCCFSVSLIRMAQDEEDDRVTVARLLERLMNEIHVTRIDLLSCDAGPVTTIHSTGTGLDTTLGARVLESELSIGPERIGGGWELGSPVRMGTRVLGALACRWPMDRPVCERASELLELVGAVLAPRLDGIQAVAREDAHASLGATELVGESAAIVDVRKAITRAARAPFGVLIEGESGSGKELAARALHQLSPRRERAFCDLNCAALPDDLLESELFGHARGAFSGAVVDRAGLFESADGGTLFLDEVADLSPRAQAKLLRVIQQQEVRRVGESFSRPVDVRLVAAANRDMRSEAAAGRFRQDLLYRLDVIRIRMPPLRERPDDVPALASHFWRLAAGRVGSKAELSSAVLAELARYPWPGNVRELQNVIASMAVAAPSRGQVRPALLPAAIGTATQVSSGRLAEAREQFERRFVEVALARAGGSRARAARSLGLTRQGLLKTMARLRLCVIVLGIAMSLLATPAAAADWLSLQTTHFRMIGDVGANELKAVALRFEQFRDTITTLIPEFADTDRPSPPVVVIVFRDQRSYEPYQPRFNGKPVRVGGYYLGGRDMNYITLSATSRGADFETVYHEFTHLLVGRLIPGVPPWLNEGMAEFFSTFEVAGTSAKLGEPRQDHWNRLAQSQMPLAELFAVSRESASYNEGQRRTLFYAQSWLLMHYALVAKPELFPQLLRFQARVESGAPTATAFREVVGVEMKALEEEVARYARRPVMTYRVAKLNERGTSRIEGEPARLPEPEAQAWLGDLLMRSGRTEDAAAMLEQVLKKSPDLPMAHASLGTLLLRADKPQEAVTHLERAIASNAANEFAYFYYGAAVFERADDHRPAAEDTRKAVAALARAVELRPGFTEADRILGYGYLLLDEREKARDAFRRALDGEPGDESLALQLADAELRLGRFREARLLLGPVASRSQDAAVRQRARDLLARSAAIEEQQTVRRSAGLSAPAAPAPSASAENQPAAPPAPSSAPQGGQRLIPVFRDTAPGETRTYGVFTQVDCLPMQVVIHVTTAQGTLTVKAARFDAIDFVSYRQDTPRQIACGRQGSPQEVFVTWRPAQAANELGTAVAVELLPEGWTPAP